MPILKVEERVCDSDDKHETNQTETCLAVSSFQDHIHCSNWNVVTTLLQKHQLITETINDLSELPLHTAIFLQAPEKIIYFILLKSEHAVFHANLIDQFPLHLVVKYFSSLRVIMLLIEKYPFALEYKDHMNMTPRDYSKEKDRKVTDLLMLPVSFWIGL